MCFLCGHRFLNSNRVFAVHSMGSGGKYKHSYEVKLQENLLDAINKQSASFTKRPQLVQSFYSTSGLSASTVDRTRPSPPPSM